MKLKYYLRGLGIGIIVTTVILAVSFSKKEIKMSDEEIMARAAQLLTESRLPISTISTMVSYPNQLHFSRAFKNIYGISPRDYRAKHLAL